MYNHPSSPEDNDLYILKGVENIETNTTNWGKYHSETSAIPIWCPLRKLKEIDLGIKIPVELDKRLFEENNK